ncbi:MAG: SDR family NAD(P)-dependent oxidoreductase [Planctomycetes bacterium]|nr:SDR family NAD(P)-dependent oxidoreductase [Planctomycetota bacterium]
MDQGIAIVGMACIYPDARSPRELWENVMAQRRAFRRIPAQRLRLEDYFSVDRSIPDSIYASEAALIRDYEFDRLRHKVVGSTYRSADLAHWLALDVAGAALADAGFSEAEGLNREETAVILGNTLTGEFSRANSLRLRWPYVRRVVHGELREKGWSDDECSAFLEKLEQSYKSPFAIPGEESLAGGLSNTIAGRVCNHFDLKGGGYTVDGACAASLLAVTNACAALKDGDVSVALAGGVDLSLDPFELVGFARTGALAPEMMRVYDARSNGFWPGEGCGFVVLMRERDAIKQDRQIYGVIRGWGVSSDGSGGITRPEVAGQKIALARAYRRAGFGADRISYFEGHGTGTAVGDATELRVLSEARREAGSALPPAALGSIKANIGHTKAAAGIAGFIKATLAVHNRTLPPTTGCFTPHAELGGPKPALRVLPRAEEWPSSDANCAAVSAMGFGGINTHIIIQSVNAARPVRRIANSIGTPSQDAEVFLFAAADVDTLRTRVQRVATFASGLSRSELTDVAAQLAADLDVNGEYRAAVTASSPAQLAERLADLLDLLKAPIAPTLVAKGGVFLARKLAAPRIGFLFPGQGSPAHLTGGAIRRRFNAANKLYDNAALPFDADGTSTAIAQPAIATASTAAMNILATLGITADIAVGHSLGELTALRWAGAYDDAALLALSRARGRAMSELGSPTGAMASIRADERVVRSLIAEAAAHESITLLAREGGSPLANLVIAGLNSPRQTVVSGPAEAVDLILDIARKHDTTATRLPVSHAFHSRLVAAAGPALRTHLDQMPLVPLKHRVVSTITGKALQADTDIRTLLCTQLTSPVRFIEAAMNGLADCDLLIEVGPGEILTGLAGDLLKAPVVSTDAGGSSLAPLLDAFGAAFTIGAPVKTGALFEDRFTRPIDLNREPQFFVNPCELAPIADGGDASWLKASVKVIADRAANSHPTQASAPATSTPLDLVRRLVAERTELPPESVAESHRLLNDLHLNSISVGQIVADAARAMSLPNPASPTAYANSTVAELAAALESWAADAPRQSASPRAPRPVAGVEAWIRPMVVRHVERPFVVRRASHDFGNGWRVIAPSNHPLSKKLGEALACSASGGGIALCLPANPESGSVEPMLESAKAVLVDNASRFIVVQQNGGGAALARTLHLERPDIDVAVIDVPFNHPEAASWIVAEASHASGFMEAHYDAEGRRTIPSLQPLHVGAGTSNNWPIGKSDVLLITGGGKGIAAECAVFLARETGARIALVGRSDAAADTEVVTTLRRLSAAVVPHAYLRADVTNAADVARAVREAESSLGSITAIIHAAGLNEPCLLDALDGTAFRRTLKPKIDGLQNVLAAVDAEKLRLLISFGSIIGAAGMPGQADYAVANDWLAAATSQWHASHRHCRALTIDWSVWQSVGMGHRLGKVESLMHQGVTPIPTDEGLRVLAELLKSDTTADRVIVAGRFGSPPTLAARVEPLPLLRFVERPLVDIPNVELVVDAEISDTTDPYGRDHALHGEPLFPAVVGLEAMSQVAAALIGKVATPTIIEDVALLRPIVVPPGRSVALRIAALVRAENRVEVVLRTSATDFQTDHFRATFNFAAFDAAAAPEPLDIFLDSNGHSLIPLDRDADIYGPMLFHEGRFRRVQGYRSLMARHCLAEISPAERNDWFAAYLPATLLLGDPAARDAAIHAIQSCIPHMRLLPVSVERISRFADADSRARFIRAVELGRDGDIFTYDMQMLDEHGRVIEAWTKLKLKILEAIKHENGWNPALLGNFVQRRAAELLDAPALSTVLEEAPISDRAGRSEHAINMASGTLQTVTRRFDGKPETPGSRHIAAAHAGPLTFAIASDRRSGCDIEPIAKREDSAWQALIGSDGLSLLGLITGEKCECRDAAATRIWAAMECIKKAGLPAGGPLVLDSTTPDGWVLLRSGRARIATYVAQLRDKPQPLAVAILVGDAS